MSETARQRQVDELLGTRRRQVAEALEHERFDVRVKRGEWPTERVGELYGNPVYRVDAKVPVLALMAWSHGAMMFYRSARLGRPIDTANELLIACSMEAWPDITQQFYVSPLGWHKLKRSIKRMRPDDIDWRSIPTRVPSATSAP